MRAGAVGFAGVVIDTRLGARFRGVVAADSAWPVPRRECRDWGKRPRERAHPRRHHRPLGFAEANRPPSGRLPPQTEPTTPDFSNQHHLADFLPREKKGTRKSRRRRSAHLPSTLSDRSRPGLLFVRSRLSYSGDGSERRSVHPPPPPPRQDGAAAVPSPEVANSRLISPPPHGETSFSPGDRHRCRSRMGPR